MEKLVLKDLSVNKIKTLIDNGDLAEEDFLLLAKEDDRKSVKAIEKTILNQKAKKEKLLQKYEEMDSFEREYRSKGFQFIAGLDEVGRGPLAGPVVSAAVILDKNNPVIGLDDSKKLSEKKRLELFDEIVEKCIAFSYSFIGEKLIDSINILEATKLSMLSCVEKMDVTPDLLFIDAISIKSDIKQVSIVHGDARSNSIAAASIIAKVVRDEYMKKLHTEFPQYKFSSNKGYGSREHIDAIREFGPCTHHRMSFIKNIVVSSNVNRND